MCNESGNFVSEGLGWYESHFFNDSLVCVEIQIKFGVVFLNDDLSGLFDGFGTYTAHIAEFTFHLKMISSDYFESLQEKEDTFVYSEKFSLLNYLAASSRVEKVRYHNINFKLPCT